MPLQDKDSKQEKPVCLRRILVRPATMVIYTCYPPLKRQMDVEEEKEVIPLAEEDKVILSPSIVKRIKVESKQNTAIKDQKGLKLFCRGKWGGVWGTLNRTRVTDPVGATGVEEAPECRADPRGYSLLNS